MCTWLSILVIDTPVFWQEDDFELILITVILLESMSGMSCGPCHMIAPVFRKISKDFAGKAYFRKATRWTSDNLFVRCIRCHKNLQMSAFTVTARTLMYIDRWNQIFGIREICQPAIILWYKFQWFNFDHPILTGAGFCSSSIPSWKLTLFHPKIFFKMMFPFSRWDLLVLWRVTMKNRWFGRSMWQRTSNWQVSRAFATRCSFVSASCVRHDFVVMLRNIYVYTRGGFSRSLPLCIHIVSVTFLWTCPIFPGNCHPFCDVKKFRFEVPCPRSNSGSAAKSDTNSPAPTSAQRGKRWRWVRVSWCDLCGTVVSKSW